MKRTLNLLAISLLMVCNNLVAQEAVSVTRMTGQVKFDGIPDEPLWDMLSKFELTMHRPTFGLQPTEDSDVRMGYDDEFLWIGAKLYMRDASLIFSPSRKRDEMLQRYDGFGILLDTYDDNVNGLAFYTNPSGLRTDYTISNDAQMSGGPGFGSAMNLSWNTFWDVKTSVDDKGWYVEMRIPFSSLKFKPSGDVVTMGLIIVRTISANNETNTHPAVDPKYGFMATNKPSIAADITFSGLRPTKPVYISPYVIGGFSQDWIMNEEESGYVKNDPYPEYSANAGLDVKYNINSNLTLDLTANTDFAQVEADDQRVNLTRYSLFFPEKRMFFQERSSIFDFSLGGRADNLFYSRNIGIAGQDQIRILGGGRITGRVGNWDLGLMDMQTAKHESTPGENFGVLRMRRQVINENSYVGGIFTSRIAMNVANKLAYGLDGIFRLFGDDYLNVKWSQTYDSELDNTLGSLDPSFFLINWQRRSEKGFSYNVGYFYSGQEFTPGIGFVRMEAVQGVNTNLRYGWFPGENSKLFDYGIGVSFDRFNRLEDGELESMSVSPEIELSTKKGFRGSIVGEYSEEGVRFPFNLSDDIAIAPGLYSFYGIRSRINTPQNKMISFWINLNAGQFYDGNRKGTQINANFNISSSFRLGVEYEFNALRFPERSGANSLDIHSINMKALCMLSTKLSISGLVQYLNTEDELITNFRLRYNPREGNDFNIVYNDFRGINRLNSIPEIPSFFGKTVMVKYTHTFIL